jgi:hypothetical protein
VHMGKCSVIWDVRLAPIHAENRRISAFLMSGGHAGRWRFCCGVFAALLRIAADGYGYVFSPCIVTGRAPHAVFVMPALVAGIHAFA